MDNRTINQIRNNETKLINEIKKLEEENQKYKEAIDKLSTRLEYFLIGNSKYQSSQEEFIKLLNVLKEVE